MADNKPGAMAELNRSLRAIHRLKDLLASDEGVRELIEDRCREATLQGQKAGREKALAGPPMPDFWGCHLVGAAFSLGMVPGDALLDIRGVSLEIAQNFVRWATDEEGGLTSCVGHESTAQVFSALLGRPVAANRVAVTLEPGQRLLVGTLGVRLAEGQVLSAAELEALPLTWQIVCRVR